MSEMGINPELQRELDETKCAKIAGYGLIVLGTILCIARLGLYIKIRVSLEAADLGAYWALLVIGLALMTIGVILLVHVRKSRAEVLHRWQTRVYTTQPCPMEGSNVQYFTPTNLQTQYGVNMPFNQPPSYQPPGYQAAMQPSGQQCKPEYMVAPPPYDNIARQS